MSFWALAALAAIAAFAAITSFGSLLSWAVAPRVERERDAALRARRLVALRLLPSLTGLALGLGLVLPAFLLLEPRDADETPGIALLLLATLGAVSIAAGLRRSIGDFRATRMLRRVWEREGRPLSLLGSPAPAYAIRHPFPVISVVGVLRPRLFVAEQVLQGLSPAELAAVVAHETGHLSSLDNLKRLALRLAPPLPWPGLSRRLDTAWEDAAEAAADTHAPNGLELASALVKTARLIPVGSRLDLPVAALQNGGSVARRVRLLIAASESAPAATPRRVWAYALALVAAVVFVASAFDLAAVHAFLEPLVHIL